MASELDICNLALQWLGQDPITNLLAPTNRPEQLCALNYPLARDAFLEEHMWSFALKRAVLNPTGNTPEWGDGFEFQVPANTMAIWRLYDSAQYNNQVQPEFWRREGNYVYSTSANAYALIGTYVTDTTRFSPTFVQALASRLAMDLAIPMTENVGLMQQMQGQFAIKAREAVAADGFQGRRETIKAERLLTARRS